MTGLKNEASLDTQGWDRVEAEKSKAYVNADNGQDVPRIDLSRDARSGDVRPPLKPFGAKMGMKNNPFFSASHNNPPPSKILQSGTAVAASTPPQPSKLKGRTMSDRFSPDRMAAFSPQVAKRIADIPNLTLTRNNDDIDGKRLLIGKQIRMSGEISGCEKLVIEGKVDANLSGVKTLDVTVNGAFKGNAEVDSAVIAGTYEGSLKVNGHLEVAPSGVVKGSVSYKTISVANGGKLLGSIESIES